MVAMCRTLLPTNYLYLTLWYQCVELYYQQTNNILLDGSNV